MILEKTDPRIFIAASFIALISIYPFDTSFYLITRTVVCAASVIAAVQMYNKHWLWIAFGFLAFLYNPVFPVYLKDKDMWSIINVVTSFLFAVYYLEQFCVEKIKIKYFSYFSRSIVLGQFVFPFFALSDVLEQLIVYKSSHTIEIYVLIISVIVAVEVVCGLVVKFFNSKLLDTKKYWAPKQW
jgi:hypothetical protein